MPFFTGRPALVPVLLYNVLLEVCVRASPLPKRSLHVERRPGSRWVCVPLRGAAAGGTGRGPGKVCPVLWFRFGA